MDIISKYLTHKFLFLFLLKKLNKKIYLTFEYSVRLISFKKKNLELNQDMGKSMRMIFIIYQYFNFDKLKFYF